MRYIGEFVGALGCKPIAWRPFQAILCSLILSHGMALGAHAHDTRSTGQNIYLPVYSAIAQAPRVDLDLTVMLSFRNVDESVPIKVNSVTYFDTSGKKIKELLDGVRTLAPFGSSHILIGLREFRGDVGANVVVAWSAASPARQPLVEAIMVGSQGTRGWAFTSRGVVLD